MSEAGLSCGQGRHSQLGPGVEPTAPLTPRGQSRGPRPPADPQMPPPALTCPGPGHLGQELEARVPHLPAGAAQALLQHREKLWGGRAVQSGPAARSLPRPHHPHPLRLSVPLGGTWLPPRKCWVWGSRSQQPGGRGELSSHLSVAWKAFLRTWGGRAGCRASSRSAHLPHPTPPHPILPPPGREMGPASGRWSTGFLL